MKHHSDWIGESPETIRITGGASKNDGILQVFADIFNAELCRLQTANSAALGAALMAAHGAGESWDSLFERFSKPDPDSVKARPEAHAAYCDHMKAYIAKL